MARKALDGRLGAEAKQRHHVGLTLGGLATAIVKLVLSAVLADDQVVFARGVHVVAIVEDAGILPLQKKQEAGALDLAGMALKRRGGSKKSS